jgi:hypothetical protein
MFLACFWTANHLAGIFLLLAQLGMQEEKGKGKLVRLTAISSLERGSIFHTYMYILILGRLARSIDGKMCM